uniref:PDZ domain-containing protein n=1 Tax=Cebus imitator TaxID=2715852 RepID=A0A2K5SFB7_CEBIM
SLVGPVPWGFQLQGGNGFNMPLTISCLKDGGDVVLSIDGISAQEMTHFEAQNKIKGVTLNMTLQRASAAPRPEPIPVQKGGPKGVPTVTSVCSKTSQELAEGQRRGSQGDSKQQSGLPRKHVVECNSEFYHIPTHSDASKKTLSEATEDWYPRTGMTQSPSFGILAQKKKKKESETNNTKKAKEKIPLHVFSPKCTKLRD